MKAIPLSRYLLFFSIALGGCLADLFTKHWIFARLRMPAPGKEPWWVWEGVFGFQTSLNQGALFGIGQGMTPVFAGLSIAAAAAILWWLFRAGAASDLPLTTALGCVMAGILGNLYDRLGLPGLEYDGRPVYAVRDWILVMIGNWPWPTFNIADSLLVCGAGLLIWHAFWTKPETQSENG